ncbi:acetylornithine and succinylornithine aminotransferase [Solidesulfovibrio carbinoliphilus subsp. oakridgensis]|uniref:Acetylornithine aminotransferase n=1 Tax=Solidesulfovibrio carbinoliphilus subsp. oakridgensis TaxID=694327 RepID=G7Q543_9BACT|nr:aspartate aminotransferase family protein [Solidesulfovibrio carbinoliphilus]EHJ48366.1 acetylornithine and succinylornithine aminotransferase [Solidesulfovibrio carbinoliphilus subsp. oakridgensis]
MSEAFDALKAREQASVMNTYGRYPLAVASAKGCRLYDLDGREYIDLLAGIAVCNLGHCREEIAETVAAKARELVHVSNLFYQREQVELAEAMKATCHAGKVFFCNSGAEANEGAIKLARRYMRTVKNRDAYEIITLSGSFHGRTLATLTATGQDKIKFGFAPLPEGFVTVPAGDIAAMEAAMGDKTAAVLLECIQGEGGVKPFPKEYLQAVAKLCRDRDVLFMVDEVQTGMCRTGKFWSFQNYGLEPDVFTCSKALANGLPMGAVLATDAVAEGFVPGSHATTFGGGALVAAAATRTIAIMNDDRLAERAARMGDFAMALFEDVKSQFPDKIEAVRGLGLMLGIGLTFPGGDVWKELLNRGFVLNLTQDKVLRLLPPLVIEQEDLKRFAAALADVLGKL